MIISGGKIIAIDKVNTDGVTLSGDGVFKPLGVVGGGKGDITHWYQLSGEVPMIKDIDMETLSSTSANSVVVGSGLSNTFNIINETISSTSAETIKYVNNVTSSIKPNVSADTSYSNCYVLYFGEEV